MQNNRKLSRRFAALVTVLMVVAVSSVPAAAAGTVGLLGLKQVVLADVLPVIADVLGAILAVAGVIIGVVKIAEAKMDSNDAAKDAGVRSIVWGVGGGAALAILVNLFI